MHKPKQIIIAVIALLLIVITPAQAHAPKVSDKQMKMLIAEKNPKQYALFALKPYKWDKKQYVCLAQLWGKESAWNHKANNPKSTAYGIAQILGEKSKHPMLQIDNGLRYIKHRYGQPCTAWRFWQRNNWY